MSEPSKTITPDFSALMAERIDPDRDAKWFDECLLRLGELDAFRVLEGASFLEGTLRLKRGRVAFEWDADSDGPLFPFLLYVVQNGEVLP